jgi:hypothetical protein
MAKIDLFAAEEIAELIAEIMHATVQMELFIKEQQKFGMWNRFRSRRIVQLADEYGIKLPYLDIARETLEE